MDLPESYSHSFVIKIWIEETADEAGESLWRGHVTHVPSGERRSIKELDEISLIITPYLEAMGVKSSYRQRLNNWHRQLKKYMNRD